MNSLKTLNLILLTQAHIYACLDTGIFFENINTEYLKFNKRAAELAWRASIEPGNPVLPVQAANYQRILLKWQQETCDNLLYLRNQNKRIFNTTQNRQTYLLCRGPQFTFKEMREASDLLEELQSIYSGAKICIPTVKKVTKSNVTEIEDAILYHLSNNEGVSSKEDSVNNRAFCMAGEAEVDAMMAFSRNETLLKWLWLAWRGKVGPSMKKPYKDLVRIENRAARRNGFPDIGASWREELETRNLRKLCRNLYHDIKPLYRLLHGVARFSLRKRYGDIVSERGPIPAHLLGNLWSMNWEHLTDLIVPKTLNLDDSIKKLNWTVLHMVKSAEDFYQSLGLPPMTRTFWRESVFSRKKYRNVRCHGTAADMFTRDDYSKSRSTLNNKNVSEPIMHIQGENKQLLYCSGTTAEDFYVLHHELGHIQYYMAYQQQPAIFRQANAALHETIGDAIMYGVNTPQHLYRLGLVNESILYENAHQLELNLTPNVIENNYELFQDSQGNNKKIEFGKKNGLDFDNLFSSDDILMLKTALNKIPQIPFSLVIDEYRWKYFEGSIKEDSLNKYFWDLSFELQGIAPPEERSEADFDIAAIFHVADNTPYIRYFLSSFLQHQLFERLCKTAVYGHRDVTDDLPSSLHLMRCDLYGSKAVGKLLKDLMSRGQSQHWREILKATTHDSDISAAALMRYYRPLRLLLERVVRRYRIPIGW